MVVIAIIALIIAMGVPAFNSMNIQQRQSKARQLLASAMTRTHIIAVSDQDLAALRIMPAEWYLDRDSAATGSPVGRQILATYSWKQTASPDPYNPLTVGFAERFGRVEDSPTQLLPPDTWVAPAEAFATDTNRDDVFWKGTRGSRDVLGNYVLQGEIGTFQLDVTNTRGGEMLDADDFLVIFDPESGVLRPTLGQERRVWPLYAFDPRPQGTQSGQTETAGWGGDLADPQFPYQRHNYSGVVIYQREPFASLGAVGDVEARRGLLERDGHTHYVSRGGGLSAGAGEQLAE